MALIIEVLAIVFLEVVVVILVGVANALTHFGHQIIGNYMLCAIAGPAPSDRLALGPTILILVEV